MKRVKLSEVCVIKTGKTPSTKNSAYFYGKINWYTPGDIVNSKQLHKSTRTITELALEQNKAVKFEPGTLLMTCIGEIGRLGITQDICSSNQQITGLVPNKSLNVNYLFYTLIFNKSRLKDVANNAIVPILNNKQLSAFQIPLPDLATQKAIAAKLDKADEIRQLNKKLIEQYDALTQSLFLDMFGDPVKNEKGWEKVYLGDICNKVTDGVHSKPNYTDSGIPFISVKDITSGVLDFSKCKFISIEDHIKYYKRCNPEKGDILYTKVGATYGRPSIVDTNEEFSLYVSVALLKPKFELISTEFFKDILKTDYVKNQADRSIKGIGVPDLHLNMIKKFELILPPLTLQNEFAERVKAIEAQKALAQQALQQSEDLFNSLLQESFQ